MRRIILCLLFQYPLFVSAQLLDTSKVWSEMYCITGGGTTCWSIRYKVQIDSIVSGVTYYGLYAGDSLGTTWYQTSHTLTEDVQNKKVYFDGNLFYDFLLNVGDSAEAFIPWAPTGCKAVVDSVDTAFFAGAYRRRIFFGGWNPTIWVDGVGSTEGLFYEFISQCTADTDRLLLCLDSAGVQLYQNPFYPACFLTLDAEEKKYRPSFSIYPNPFNDRINIQSDENYSDKLFLKVIDPLGRVVFNTSITSGEQEIQLSTLPEGLYFFHLSDESTSVTIKVIKSNFE